MLQTAIVLLVLDSQVRALKDNLFGRCVAERKGQFQMWRRSLALAGILGLCLTAAGGHAALPPEKGQGCPHSPTHHSVGYVRPVAG